MSATDEYYELLEAAKQAASAHDCASELAYYRAAWPLLRSFVSATKREYGKFDLSVPAVHQAAILLAAMGDTGGLDELEAVVADTGAKSYFIGDVADGRQLASVCDAVCGAVATAPGLLQSDLAKHIPGVDGTERARACHWMEKVGRIQRRKSGKSHELYATHGWERPATRPPAARSTLRTPAGTPPNASQGCASVLIFAATVLSICHSVLSWR